LGRPKTSRVVATFYNYNETFSNLLYAPSSLSCYGQNPLQKTVHFHQLPLLNNWAKLQLTTKSVWNKDIGFKFSENKAETSSIAYTYIQVVIDVVELHR
jgi:hypothetical protein